MPACTVSVEIPSGGVAEVPDLTGELTAIDNRTPRHLLIIEQDPPPGTLVGVGAYIITTTVTDQSGNQTVCTNIFCVTAEAGGPFFNTAQSYTATCPAGSTGTPKVAIIAAGAYSSTVSQADADAQALAAAVAQANAALCCCPVGEECPECLELYDDCYPYEYGCLEYPNCPYGCYPYGFGFAEFPVFPSHAVDHWWKFEETGSATRRDAIATLNPIDFTGGLTSTTGKVGTAFSQTVAEVPQGGSADTYANTGLTFFGWMFIDAQAFSSMIIDIEFRIGAVAQDRLRMTITQDLSGTINSLVFSEHVSGTPVVPTIDYTPYLNTWVFYRAWHDGPNGKLRLQLNNGSIFESPTTWIPAAHTSIFIFFGYGSTSPRNFDETGLIKRVISPAEASFLYNNGNGRTWPFA